MLHFVVSGYLMASRLNQQLIYQQLPCLSKKLSLKDETNDLKNVGYFTPENLYNQFWQSTYLQNKREKEQKRVNNLKTCFKKRKKSNFWLDIKFTLLEALSYNAI